jgi:uncharacterized membrane protein YdjX (TVP38/TMEM64 family)/rhodanese-related sulfurtransferase
VKTRLLRVILVLLLASGITLAFIYREQFNVQALEQWVSDAGAAAPLIFIMIYAVATVLFLPGSVLTLAGGVLFGPYLGTLVNLTGATLGALAAFLVARYLARDWVRQRTGRRLQALMNGVEHEGWRFVAFVRLVPLFPFNLLNYALGLTPVRLWHYLVATYVFMLPGAIAYTYLGYAGKEALAGDGDLIQTILLAIALLAVVAFIPRFVSILRRKPVLTVTELKSSIDNDDDIQVLDVRTAEDFHGELGHIRQALNIPLEVLEQRLDDLDDDLEKTIALVCTTDRRSAKAAGILAANGFADVHVVRGGMTAWNRQGYPVEN